MVTKKSTSDVYSYPNIHGDIVSTADQTGTRIGTTMAYDPYGQALTALPDNQEGTMDYAWLGKHQRPLEHQTGLHTIEMGARQYVPSLGRFLEVDPIEGGSSNDYDYVNGDPVNGFDLDGLAPQPPQPPQLSAAEKEAIRAEKAGERYVDKDLKSANKKIQQGQKFRRQRNIAKQRGGGRFLLPFFKFLIPNDVMSDGMREMIHPCSRGAQGWYSPQEIERKCGMA